MVCINHDFRSKFVTHADKRKKTAFEYDWRLLVRIFHYLQQDLSCLFLDVWTIQIWNFMEWQMRSCHCCIVLNLRTARSHLKGDPAQVCWSVYVDCLALSISLDLWLHWLVHDTWHGIRAQGLDFESRLSQFIQNLLITPPYLWDFMHVLASPSHTWEGVLKTWSVYVDCLALSICLEFWCVV